jgi:type I restriction enzyme R subunit
VVGAEKRVRQVAEDIVSHFEQRLDALDGKAMVVCMSRRICIDLYRELVRLRPEWHDDDDGGGAMKVVMTGSASDPVDWQPHVRNKARREALAKRFRDPDDPLKVVLVRDMWLTGFDAPILHTMYVDKPLSGVKAVQTLSRLNRSHPQKYNAFVLDFANDADTIRAAFSDYYRTTILSEETDPDRLHDLKAALDGSEVYGPTQVEELVERFLAKESRERLDPILDTCVAAYRERLDEDGQVEFKGRGKAFLRAYGFLGAILPYTNAEWERLSIFLTFLVPKLPAPVEDDLSNGILEAIDMDSYRVEKRAVQQIMLPDEDAEIDPVPTSGGGHLAEPELDRLSNILQAFNDLFGDIAWDDRDRVGELITKTIPARVAADAAFRNARENSDDANARIEHDKVLARIVTGMVKDDAELFKQFMDNDDFKRWMTARVFELACEQAGAP